MDVLLWTLVVHIVAVYADLQSSVSLPFDKPSEFIIPFSPGHDALEISHTVAMGMWTGIVVRFCFETTTQKDNTVMILHHLATLTALYISDTFGFRPVAAWILAVHNIGDVFVAVLKIAAKRKWHRFSIHLLFALSVGVWGYTRLFVFGWVIIWQTIWPIFHTQPPPQNQSVILLVVLSLVVLLCCHFYWFVLLVRMAFISPKKLERDYEKKEKFSHPLGKINDQHNPSYNRRSYSEPTSDNNNHTC
jgi:hypothetical protein